MKPVYIILFGSLLFNNSFAQIIYEKGYFIDNNNQRRECLIKDQDWKNNPDVFIYKISGSDIPGTGNLNSVKEFGIYGVAKFIRKEVEIDLSRNEINNLTNKSDPDWTREVLFLKVLLEGKASLYYYEYGNLFRFFYSVNGSPVKQLVYKAYIKENYDQGLVNYGVAYNNKFQQQLWTDMRYENLSMNSLKNLSYSRKELVKYFTKYNQSLGDTIVKYNNELRRESLNIKISPGINYSIVSVYNNIISTRDLYFGNNYSLRLGIETEYILPYYKNKWGIIIEPTFQYYHSGSTNSATAQINYNSLEFPVGLRYYMFLNNNTKIFINGFYDSNYCLNFHSDIAFNDSTRFKIATQKGNIAAGCGIVYNRLSAEVRYYSNRDLLTDYTHWKSENSSICLFIGYTFKNRKPVLSGTINK